MLVVLGYLWVVLSLNTLLIPFYLFQVLDPAVNTLPYLHSLLAHIASSSGKQSASSISKRFSPQSPLWQKMAIFMEKFDPIQVRYAGVEFRRLLELAAAAASKSESSV